MKDTTELFKKRQEDFLAACVNLFTPKPVGQHNEERVRKFKFVSFLPNAISMGTAFIFVYFLVEPFPKWVKMVFGLLAVMFLFALEVGKRYTFHEMAIIKNTENRVNAGLAIAVFVLFVVSASISYSGGTKIPEIVDTPPPKEINPEIADIDKQVATINSSIAKQEKTTWKGRITTQANKNIAPLYQQRKTLLDRKTTLQLKDDETHTANLETHSAKITNIGYITGAVAVGSDIVLFILLFIIVGWKYEVALVAGVLPTPSQFQQIKGLASGQNLQLTTNEKKNQIGFFPRTHTPAPAPTHTGAPTQVRTHAHNAPAPTHAGTHARAHAHPRTRVRKGDKIHCKRCDKKFIAKGPRNKFCSVACREAKN